MDISYNRRLILILLGLLCIGFLSACATSLPRDAILAPVTQESGDTDLAELLNSIRLEERLPGLAAAIIIDGKIHSTAAVGIRKLGTENWVTVNDKFMIGSCGKAFTATLAAVLVEEGFIRWDTTIRDIFPDLKMLPEYENITMQQLLSHRAGLPKNFTADLDENLTYTPKNGRLLYLEQIVQKKLVNPPDEVMLYSNAGYTLAGVMMEKVTRRSFVDLMREAVFRPLNMGTAGYGAPAELDPMSEPWGHMSKYSSFVAVEKDSPHWLDPAGATLSLSIRDWANFILEHMCLDKNTDRALLKPETLKKLHTPPNNAKWDYGQLYLTFWRNRIGWPLTSSNYAFGWFTLQKEDSGDTLTHGGTSKAFMAEAYLSTVNRSAILFATNIRTSHMPLYRAAKRIKDHYSIDIILP